MNRHLSRLLESALPHDFEAEQAVLLFAMLTRPQKQVRIEDFCFGRQAFNGWLFSRLLAYRRSNEWLARLLSTMNRNSAKMRGEHNLPLAVARILHSDHMYMNEQYYIQRLKTVRRYRDRILVSESKLRKAHEAWYEYGRSVQRPFA